MVFCHGDRELTKMRSDRQKLACRAEEEEYANLEHEEDVNFRGDE